MKITPKIFIAIKNAGHEIGNHSYVHPMFSKISNEQIEEELNKTEKIFNNIAGINSKYLDFLVVILMNHH